jgi:ATP-dependent protease HslVU (ClpYQ) peptidase subunit
MCRRITLAIITYKDGVLASDSRCTLETTIVTDRAQKLFRLDGVDYLGDKLIAIGLAGCLTDFDKVLLHLCQDDFFTHHIKHDCSGIIVGNKYNYMLEPNTPFLIRCNKKEVLATGCGQAFGLSAMKLGLTAKKAVSHTIRMDMACGGRIQSIDFNNK